MLSRLLGYVVFAVVAWWAWQGPIHDWRTVTIEEQLQANADDMARCQRGKAYVAGVGGAFTADPQSSCARELKLYLHEGHWYSYAGTRPAAGHPAG